MSEIFEMNSVYKLVSDSKQDNFNIGAYNGALTMSVWREGVKVPARLPCSNGIYIQILKILTKLKTATPGAKYGLPLLEFNRDTKKSEKKFELVFGKNDNGSYYIEFMELGKPPITFTMKGTVNYKNGTEDLTAVERSENEFLFLYELFSKGILLSATLFTRNNLQKGNFNKYDNKSNNNSANSSNTSAKFNEDDLF